MSWKTIKEHYRIGHTVQISDGRICIGSSYIPDLITISMDGKVRLSEVGISGNEDLQRYYEEMTSDPGKLKELLDAPDTFEASLPVYTFEGAEIIEKQCEAHGWPNITHDGCIQYDNTFSMDKDVTILRAKRNAELGIEVARNRIAETRELLSKHHAYLATQEANFLKLEADYPAA